MKLFKFSNNQTFTNNLTELKRKSEFNKAQKGKWYHFQRIYVIKSLDSKEYGLISLNFFERIFCNICNINFFKKHYFEGRSVIVISPKKLKIASNLQELENINEQTKDAGFKGNSIFVDITSQGGEEAIKVLKNLDRKSEKENNKIIAAKTCHFGVACFVNFSLAAATKAEKIILLDYDPIVVKFNKIAREILIVASTREEFKQKLIDVCQQEDEICQRNFYPKTQNDSIKIDNLSRILDIDESFLANEDDFNHIKKLAEENKIHIYQGSIYEHNIVKAIVGLTKQEGYIFDTIFISNVYDWDSDYKKRQLLRKNIKIISNDNTKIIEVVPYPKDKCNVNIVYYKDPQSQQLYDPLIMRGKKNLSRKEIYPEAPLLVN